jgi:hypothetical protein
MKKLPFYPVLFVGLSLILLYSCQSQKDEWKGEIVEKDGATVVKNPKTPLYEGEIFHLEQDLVIGENEGQGEVLFSEVSDMDVDSDENIYILDPKETHIKVFNKQGAYLRTIGKKGQGPGEMQSLDNLSITPNHEIMVNDWSARALHFFTLDGTYLKSINLKGMIFFSHPVADSQNHILAGYTVMDQTVTNYLKIFNPDMTEKKTIYSYKAGQYPVINPFYPRCYWQIDKHDYIIWGYNDIYEIQFLKPDGSLFMKISKDYDPVKITEQEKQQFIKSNYGEEIPPGIELSWDTHHHPFIYLSVDDEGRVFVRTYEKAPNGHYYYDVFNSQGKYIAKIPLEYRPRVWKNNKLYVISQDEQGYHRVRRYKMSLYFN